MGEFIKDYGSFLAALISPIAAVFITIWYQNRQARRGAKMNLFLDLVSYRDYIPLPWAYTVALNRIDVVFHKQMDIRRLWHEYYDLIGEEQTDLLIARVREKKIALISAMAKHLGYKGIDQIFLQRYYQTKGHVNDYLWSNEMKTELLRVLKNTETLYILGNEHSDQMKKEIVEYKNQQEKKD